MPAMIRHIFLSSLVAVGLMACEQPYSDSVSEACLADGQPLKFCTCTAKGMKETLGPDNYVIFTDIIALGNDEAPGTDEIVKIMAKHGLAPETLVARMEAIEHATYRVHAVCSPDLR